MTEREWWGRVVRPALHQPSRRWLAHKIQDTFRKGVLDVWLCARGRTAWVEMKFAKRFPVRAGTKIDVAFSPEQRVISREVISAGGRAMALLGIEEARRWFLLDCKTLLENEWALTQTELETAALVCGTWGRGTGLAGLERVQEFLERCGLPQD